MEEGSGRVFLFNYLRNVITIRFFSCIFCRKGAGYEEPQNRTLGNEKSRVGTTIGWVRSDYLDIR